MDREPQDPAAPVGPGTAFSPKGRPSPDRRTKHSDGGKAPGTLDLLRRLQERQAESEALGAVLRQSLPQLQESVAGHADLLHSWPVGRADLRGRKRIEAAIRESLARYQVIFNSFPLGIAIADKAGRIVETNEAGRQLLGLPRGGQARGHIGGPGMRVLRADGSPMPTQELASTRALKECRVVSNVGVGILKKDGGISWLDVTAAPIPIEGGGVAIVYWDVTQRLLMEAAWREVQGRYEEAENIAHFGHWARDYVHHTAIWSQGLYRIFGRDASSFEPSWENFIEAVHPDDRPNVDAQVKAALARREPLFLEYRIVLPDGTVRTVETTARPTSAGKGRAIGLLGTVHDITDRRRAEEALRRGEARYRSLFENMIEGLAHCRMIYRRGKPVDFVYVDVNGAFETITGLKDVVGKRVCQLIPGFRKSNPEVLAAYERVASTGRPERFEAEVAALGRWFDVSAFSPQQGHFMAVFDDVTQRKRAEQALLASEERLRSVIEQSPVAIGIHRGGTVIYVNEAYVRMFGYRDKDEIIGRSLLEQIAPCDRKVVAQTIRRRGKELSGLSEYETAGLRPDGTEFPFGIVVAKVILPDGPAAIGFLTDLSERKRAQEENEKLQSQLLQAQKMEAIGRLAGGVAHDFRNQLTVIKGFSEMVLRQGLVAPEGRDKIEEVVKAADRAALLAAQLLAFSRQETLQPRAVDLSQLVADVGKALPRLVGEDVHLHIHPSPRTCVVKVDPGQLQQTLFNLAANARDAMPAGGELTIQIAAAPPQDRLADRHGGPKRGSYALLTVTDSGCGMDARTRARIFEPFFTTKPVGEGTGLGLAMVYGFVTQSGGEIEVDTKPGKGTSVRLYFPLISHSAAAAPARATSGKARAGKGTILLVEDEPAVRAMLAQSLEEGGYTVLEAASARAALELARGRRGAIDALVTDVVMPGGSGVELAGKVRSAWPKVPILFMSGYANKELSQRGAERFGGQLLTKPCDHATLLKAVRQLLAGARKAT